MSAGGDDLYLSGSDMKASYGETTKHQTVSPEGEKSVCSDCFQEHASRVGWLEKQLQTNIFIMHTHVRSHECPL